MLSGLQIDSETHCGRHLSQRDKPFRNDPPEELPVIQKPKAGLLAKSVQQQDPTDQRRPSHQRHNVDQLPTARRPVGAVPCKVMHRIGFIRVSLDCRHDAPPPGTTAMSR
jgi:hypothetical protein